MMLGKILLISLIILTLLNFIFPKILYSKESKRILILYEGKTRLGENYPMLELLKRYLRHFNVSIDSSYIEDLPSNVSSYDYVFYLGLQDRRFTVDLLRNISKAKRLIWIEGNIEQYAYYANWKDLEYYGYKTGYMSIFYKGESISFELESPVYIAYPRDRKDLALLDNYTEKTPFVWEKENLWYFGRLDFRDNSFLVFFDLLHDILNENHKNDRKILLLLDEVTPLTSAEKLRELLISYCCEDVSINLIIYPKVNHSGNTYYLGENMDLIEVLKLVEEHNGAIILGNYPNKRDINSIIEEDLLILGRLEIFPIAFKLPDTSLETYEKASKIFNLLLYEGLLSISSPKAIAYPINMNGYNPNDPTQYNYLLKRAREFRILRDAIIGITVPSYATTDKLRELIGEMRALGYNFLELRKEPFKVESKYMKIVNIDGEKVINSSIPPLEETFLQKVFKTFINYLRTILIITISIFAIIIFYLIRNKRKLYEMGDKV